MPEPRRPFRRYDLDQTTIVPHDLRDWLPEGHLAFFMMEIMEHIDLEAFYAYHDNDGRGCVPYDPRMMVTVILYSYATGVNSARQMARMLYSDVPLRFLAGDNFPDHRTINVFRVRHADALGAVLRQTVDLAREAGLARMGIVALDGTKMKANASLAKNRDRDAIDEKIKRDFDEYLKRAQELDRLEDEEFGEDGDGFIIPASFGGRKEMRRRLDEAKKQIDAEEARLRQEEGEKADARKTKEEEAAKQGKKLRGRKPKQPDEKQTQLKPVLRNITDADSRSMKSAKGYEQAYNLQCMTDCGSHIILDVDTVQDANDKLQLEPMLDRLIVQHGRPNAITDDAGYFSAQALKAALERGVMVFMPSKNRHKLKNVVREGPPPDHLTEVEKMEWIMATPAGRQIYKLRCSTAEPCFGILKQAMGFRQFVLRGLKKVKLEARLMATGKNFMRMNIIKNERKRRGDPLFPSEIGGVVTR